MTKIAIFLGAGASKAEGAPLQGELFYEYFSSESYKKSSDHMDRELATFFQLMFAIDVDQRDLSKVTFPTFEEVLGLTDLAIMRKEAFKEFDLENRASNSGRLRFIAQYLVFLVAKVLDWKLKHSTEFHKDLVNALQTNSLLGNTVFISTNYDILIDNALTEMHACGFDLDYGVDFVNYDLPYDWHRPNIDNRVELLKPHGSLNWLFCPTCNNLKITPKEKGVVTRLIIDFRDAACPECGSIYMPLIVPPSFYKDLNNAFLSAIWNRADNALRKVEHIVFCGYSFPDADIHIKYLLKRAQTNRQISLKFTVINHYPGKRAEECQEEAKRYKRFLGDNVIYTNQSFQEFSSDPMNIIKA